MDDISHISALKEAIAAWADPGLEDPMLPLGTIHVTGLHDGHAELEVRLSYPPVGVRQSIQESIEKLALSLSYVKRVTTKVIWSCSQAPGQTEVAEVRNLLAVASAKGGVGKSTTAVNLALALRGEGARVGLLDADIYGPSQQQMLGIPSGKRPRTSEGKQFIPVEAYGLQTMSMGYLIDPNTPAVWRGPMASNAVQQMLTQTRWDNLDYLVIDMPPGTGDIQLTLTQKVPLSGAVIVTTPHELAVLDARKAIEMFRKLDVPLLGVVENMSYYQCSQCGHQESLFGDGGGMQLAKEYDINLLGCLPLAKKIRQATDGGKPTVIEQPQSPLSLDYRIIARRVAAAVHQAYATIRVPQIVIHDD